MKGYSAKPSNDPLDLCEPYKLELFGVSNVNEENSNKDLLYDDVRNSSFPWSDELYHYHLTFKDIINNIYEKPIVLTHKYYSITSRLLLNLDGSEINYKRIKNGYNNVFEVCLNPQYSEYLDILALLIDLCV